MRLKGTWWWVATSFVCAAVAFAAAPASTADPEREAPAVSAEPLSLDPPRPALGHPPVVQVGDERKDCKGCHVVYFMRPDPRELRVHTDVKPVHGSLKKCLGCHHRDKRNHLIVHDPDNPSVFRQKVVPFDASHTHCGACHAEALAAWERGYHGRATGSWDRASEARGKLTCVQCHDPHVPVIRGHTGPATLPPPAELGGGR